MSDGDDVCGSTDTTSGEPCQFSPGDSCPWHDTDETPDTRNTALEEDPSLTDKVAERLAAGDTVAVACAEVPGVSEDQYYEWRRRADEDGGVFADFRKETTRARRGAGRRDKNELKQEIEKEGDTRTWYKLHMKQYGDQYGDEDMDMREEGVRQNIPEDLVTEWYERQG
jgi:transposase-like protein